MLINYVGGNKRVCCLGNEATLIPDTLRDTGDIGYMDKRGLIHVTGRCDHQLKRRGHRMNLDYIQQVKNIILSRKCIKI